ncbi:MAG: hypothetical protein ABIB71_03235 [Candidatus Woesearchaeota archaeon]
MHKYNGTYFQIDGLDGVGKGTIIVALTDYEKSKGKKIFDLDAYQKQHNSFPAHKGLLDADTIFCSEPTYCGVGLAIRDLLINSRSPIAFSAISIAEAFALDRRILLESAVIPALKAGKTIIQSRGVASSLVYQPVQAKLKGEEITEKNILNIEGNKFELENAPNFLVIPTIKNPDELLDRLSNREKKDDSIFDNVRYQMEFKPRYESKWLRDIFETGGTAVKYLDAGISVESTREQIVEIWEGFLKI